MGERPEIVEVPKRSVSQPNGHPADGMTITVDVGGAFTTIIDPRSFKDGGPEWTMRYGNCESIRYTVASLLESYDYLLSENLTTKEAVERLRILRKHRSAAYLSQFLSNLDYSKKDQTMTDPKAPNRKVR